MSPGTKMTPWSDGTLGRKQEVTIKLCHLFSDEACKLVLMAISKLSSKNILSNGLDIFL